MMTMPDLGRALVARIMAKTVAAMWLATALAAAPAFAAETKPRTTIVIDHFSLSPAQVSVASGSTVTWEHNDDIPPTLVNDSTPGECKSAPRASGEHTSHT